MVLERHDARDDGIHAVGQDLPERFQGVAHPLGVDADGMQRRDVGPAQHRLVGPQVLIGQPDAAARGVAHEHGQPGRRSKLSRAFVSTNSR